MTTAQGGADYDHLFKILIIGASGSGKSCILMRYSDNQFTNNFYNTIGVDFKIKSIQMQNKAIKLQIWDTAGQERFKTITCSYYKGAHGIMVVFDLTDKDSFEQVKNWFSEIEKYGQEGVCKSLVGNKSDLTDKRQVTKEQAQELANEMGVEYLETSAKLDSNVDKTFNDMCQQILTKVQNNPQKPQNQRVQLRAQELKDQNNSSGCLC